MSRSGAGGERGAPRRSGAALRAIGADLVLGVRLAWRHRTPRLAGVLAGMILVLAVLRHRQPEGPAAGVQTVLIIGGTLAAAAASRLLAPGPALTAARRAAAPAWVAPAGRLAGALLLVLPVVWTASCLIGRATGAWSPLPVGAMASLHAAAVAALVLAATPLLGASGSAGLGLGVVGLGSILPSSMSTLLDPWPLIERPVVLLWNTLPLGWRAQHAILSSAWSHTAVFAGWIALGAALAAWTSLAALEDASAITGGDSP